MENELQSVARLIASHFMRKLHDESTESWFWRFHNAQIISRRLIQVSDESINSSDSLVSLL